MKLFSTTITMKGVKPVIRIALKQLEKLLDKNDVEYTVDIWHENLCQYYVDLNIDIDYKTVVKIQEKLEGN